MNSQPVCIDSYNLSLGWTQAFMVLIQPGVEDITTLIVTITGFDTGQPCEDSHIRETLDQALYERGLSSCQTVAGTIFPDSLWHIGAARQALFDRYLRIWSRIERDRRNQYGTYFHRLIAFGPATDPVNQLDHIITTYRADNHRRSALQAVIFDPTLDHTHQRQRGFPCLQHVLFTPDEHTRQLTVTGLYAMQHIFEKAYGNYLGLCRLGRFMAHEMGLQLTRMVCIANVARLGNYGKRNLHNLAWHLHQRT